MFTSIEIYLTELAYQIPLELFVFLGSIIEEIIAPIPSPGILLLAGSLASVQGYTLLGLLGIVLCGSIGKTLGALGVYTIADTAENLFSRSLTRFFPISEGELKRLGRRFTGTPKDYAVFIFLRALPFIPSVVLSGGAGLLRIPRKLFIVGTCIGTLIRDGIYLYIGFVGLELYKNFTEGTAQIETVVEILFLIFSIGILVYIYTKRRRSF